MWLNFDECDCLSIIIIRRVDARITIDLTLQAKVLPHQGLVLSNNEEHQICQHFLPEPEQRRYQNDLHGEG